MKIKFEVRTYAKKIKHGKVMVEGFRYKTIPASQLVEWGVPEIVAGIIDAMIDRFLRTWPLKIKHLANYDKSTDPKASEAERADSSAVRNCCERCMDTRPGPGGLLARPPRVRAGESRPHSAAPSRGVGDEQHVHERAVQQAEPGGGGHHRPPGDRAAVFRQVQRSQGGRDLHLSPLRSAAVPLRGQVQFRLRMAELRR